MVAIGTELLLGQVVDTNSAWLGECLARAGIDCQFQAKVGDNHARIVAAIRQALARSDAVICCGGLGPTPDDITREALAEVMGAGLARRPEVAGRIEAMFSARGRPMPLSNLRQADVPEGATPVLPVQGSAPGLICPVGEGKVVYALPGVPHEMQEMMERAVMPDLAGRGGAAWPIVSRSVRTWGLSEAAVAEMLAPRLAAAGAGAGGAGGPASRTTIAFLANAVKGVTVRVTATAPAGEARARLDREEAEIRSTLGDAVFGVDDETMESALGSLLAARGLSLGVAESLTGGLIGSRLTSVAGASAWFRGSIVSYASEVKQRLLGVAPGPVVSAAAAEQMALGACGALGADAGLGITGVAGPAEAEGQPVGTVWAAVALSGRARAVGWRGSGGRHHIRQWATTNALDLVRRRLLAGEA